MNYEIFPYLGVGALRFEMDDSEIHKIIGEPLSKFNRSPYSKEFTEEYSEFFIIFNESKRCIAFEFFPSATVIYKKVNLFSLSIKEIRKLFCENSHEVIDNDSGFTSFEYGIGVYSYYMEDEDSVPESIIVFKKGYYD